MFEDSKAATEDKPKKVKKRLTKEQVVKGIQEDHMHTRGHVRARYQTPNQLIYKDRGN